LLVIAFVMTSSALTACADNWRDGSAILTCDPHEGHIELLSQQNYFLNLEKEEGEVTGQNVYFPSQLEEEPFVCHLPEAEVIVEGRNRIAGRGACGAKAGAQVRVTINGKPVAYAFKAANTSTNSTSLLQDGWIEPSDCFDRMRTVDVLSRIEDLRTDGSQELIAVSGA
jgi:hypothetical protein